MIVAPERPLSVPGLRGYWPMGEPGGYVVDYSGWRNNGRKFGTTVAAGRNGRPANAFNGTSSDYVTLGGAPKAVGLPRFTVACWFKRTSTGATFSTGTGGRTLYPLVTHGLGEADGSNLDCNWAMGIHSTSTVLSSDFESYLASSNNNPVDGTTVISNDVWYHAAATFDGTNHRVWVNGRLEGTLVTTQIPRSDSIQHVGIGTAMNSSGARTGFFAGVLQDVCIFSYALSANELVLLMRSPYLLDRRLRWQPVYGVAVPSIAARDGSVSMNPHRTATASVRPHRTATAGIKAHRTGAAIAKASRTATANIQPHRTGTANVKAYRTGTVSIQPHRTATATIEPNRTGEI